MGLLTKIAMLPLAPVSGVVWVAKRLQEYAEQELEGEVGLRRRLAEIDAAHAAGEISDGERERLEGAVLERSGVLGEEVERASE